MLCQKVILNQRKKTNKINSLANTGVLQKKSKYDTHRGSRHGIPFRRRFLVFFYVKSVTFLFFSLLYQISHGSLLKSECHGYFNEILIWISNPFGWHLYCYFTILYYPESTCHFYKGLIFPLTFETDFRGNLFSNSESEVKIGAIKTYCSFWKGYLF